MFTQFASGGARIITEGLLVNRAGLDVTSGAWTPTTPGVTLRQWNAPEQLSGSNNDPITTWTAAAGKNLSNTGGTTRPLLKTGGPHSNLYLAFDGSDDYVMGANWVAAQAQPFTAAYAFRVDQAAPYQGYIADGNNSANRMAFYSGSSTSTTRMYASVNEVVCAAQDTSWHTMILKWNGVFSAYAQDGSTFTTVSATPGSDTVNGVTVGSAYGGNLVNGKISFGELMIYDTILGSTDLSSLGSYLTARWL